MNFTSRVISLQASLGGMVVLENPEGSDLWRHPLVQQFVQNPNYQIANLDMCRFGLRSLVDDVPLRKPMSLLTNSGVFAKEMSVKCDGSHPHEPIQGNNTKHSGIYTKGFARAVVKAYDRAARCSKEVKVHFPTSHRGEDTLAVIEKEDEDNAEDRGAAGISFRGKVSPMVAAVLKRVHQNLGHPPNREMVRHLRLGGAGEAVVRAAEQMVCKTCEKSTKVKPSRVCQPVVALDFNEAIAADIMWLDTFDEKNRPVLNVVDLASTYQVVIPLKSTKSADVAQALLDGWINWAGAPRHLLVDLDSAFKDKFLALMDEKSVTVRCSAGQAHWQNGVAERHGSTWKSIWNKLVEDEVILHEEFSEAVAATSDAKNQLRNYSGYSPRQWVFGVQMKLPGDYFDNPEGADVLRHGFTPEEKVGRQHIIKMGARAAFFQCQTKQAIQKAVNHKARVEEKSYEPGDLVYIYREIKQAKGKKPTPSWLGPATVIGREGQNYWLARGGRCLLAAPEHLRTAHHEEVSEMLRLKMAMKELEKLSQEEADPSYDEVVPMVEDQADPETQHMAIEPLVEETDALQGAQFRERALEGLARRAQHLDDVPLSIKRAARSWKPYMVKHAISASGKEKQMEKELPWHLIPPEERELYKAAELKQWLEHVQFEAVRALSVAESREVMRNTDPSRILNARFLYKDKNYSKRKSDPSIPPKAKARLCIAGQHDPDLGRVDMATDAPTTSRHSILLALQLALAFDWMVSVGDIRAAFLNGLPAPRKLYFRQPKRGIPTLEEGQLVEVLKGVFGLSTSPKLWWMKLSSDLNNLKVHYRNSTVEVMQNEIDPCVFMLRTQGQEKVRGLLLTHVDDLMLMAEPELCKAMQRELSKSFPVDDWEENDFEYVGCEYSCKADRVEVRQKTYTNSRVEKVNIPAGSKPDDMANPEQIEENRTVIGCLSWLAKQTRPDLQFQVSQAQRKQRNPNVADLKETNKIVDAAKRHKDEGLTLHKIPVEEMCILAYHDAAWGNVRDPEEGDEQDLWVGEHNVSSQLGSLVLIAQKACLSPQGGKYSIIDWRSKASQRVCRSTFAGETMAACDGMEASLFLRCLLLSFIFGYRVPEHEAGRYLPYHQLTDCRSLYDHVHREGVPRAPTEKRLAIDLAGLRQALKVEAQHQWKAIHGVGSPTPEKPVRPPMHWVPTGNQLADILTKKLKADDWWNHVQQGHLGLPLKKPC